MATGTTFPAEKDLPIHSTTTTQGEVHAPLLSQYDPYHHTTFTVQHPFTRKPLEAGQEVDPSFLLYGISTPKWKLNYQDFCPDIELIEANTVRCTQCFQ